MAGLKEIKIRIKSVANTKKITYAMKLVAATKMRGAQEAVIRSKQYSESLLSLLKSVLSASDKSSLEHSFLQKRSIKKIRLIVVGANRGLCGSYNANVNKAVESFYREQAEENPQATIDAVLLGNKPIEFFKREKLSVKKAYNDLSENPEDWPLLEICQNAENDFENGEIDALYVIYTNFKSALSMTAKAEKLLPISIDELEEDSEAVAASVALFEPSADEVFNALLPRLLRMTVHQSALDAKAGEHASRMTAMDSATKNAGELIKSLTLKYNKLRQASITSEILDIVGGANALE